jgi:hypothetical protein
MISLQVKINLPQNLSSVFSFATLVYKKAIGVIAQIFDGTLSLPMSACFETRPFFPSTPKETNDSGPLHYAPEVVNIPIAPTLVCIPTPGSIPSPTLRTYQRRLRPPPVPQDSSLAPSDSHTPHPTTELLIALQKGNRSSRNPNPIYACHLDYNRLSTSYSAFVASLDSVSIPKTTGEAMSDPGWRQAMVDEMAAFPMVLGTWFLYPMEKPQWDVDGSIQLKLVLMARLTI